jgi:hypothetical protein
VEEISKRADKCWNMEKKLNEIYEKVREIKCDVIPFKGTFIFKMIDDIQAVLDE